jgi:hypothetical protein
VWVGAESGSQKILEAMDKGTRVEQIYEATRQLHAHGVKVAFFLQFGYPGETREDIELTLKMVRDLMPDDIGISVSYPYRDLFCERVPRAGRNANSSGGHGDAHGRSARNFADCTPSYTRITPRKTWNDQGLLQSAQPPARTYRRTVLIYHRLTLPASVAKLDGWRCSPRANSSAECGID